MLLQMFIILIFGILIEKSSSTFILDSSRFKTYQTPTQRIVPKINYRWIVANNAVSEVFPKNTKFFSSYSGNNEDENNSEENDDDNDFNLNDDTANSVTSYGDILDDKSKIDKPEDVYIILFNPDAENEGVHTIEFPKGSGNNFILAFESEIECYHFCSLLKKQQFFDPKVQQMKFEPLEEYCKTLGVSVQPIPKGMDIKPPTDTVDELDLNPNRDKEVSFLDYLYERSSSSASESSSDGAWE